MAALKIHEVREHLVLFLLVCAVAAGLAGDFHSSLPWLFLVPCAASFFWQIERLPPWLVSALRYAAWTLVATSAVIVRFFPTNQIFSPRASAQLEGFVGYALLSVSVLFLSGARVWRPGLTLFPASFAALALAAMNNTTPMGTPVIIAGTAVFTYLFNTAAGRWETHNRHPARKLFRFIAGGFLVSLIAGAIMAALPWAQVQFEQAAFQFFNMGVAQYSSLSLESRLGDIEQLLLSSKLVMRVYSSRAQKLRGRVFTRFDGESWHARLSTGEHISAAPAGSVADPDLRDWLEEIPGKEYAIPPHDPGQATAPDAIRTRIVQTVFNEGLLVAPGGKLLVRAPLEFLRLDAFEGLATPLSSDSEIYGVVNRREDDLAQPGTASPEAIEESLALPPDTDPRFRELAARLIADTPRAEERVRRTVEYVKSAARYSLRVGRFHSRQPVAEFLFEKKQGYCQYFASAAAILLRIEGVPARYVTGFEVEEGNREAGHYVVRERDAHAWIEAYVPGRGWIEADPTPEAEYESLHANAKAGWTSILREWLAAQWAEISIHVRAGDWFAASRWIWGQIKLFARAISLKTLALEITLGALVLLTLRLARRARGFRTGRRAFQAARRGPDGVAPDLAELLARVDSLWARAGFRRPPTQAPLEHLSSIGPDRISSSLREASRRAVECYYGVRYAGLRIAPAEIRAAQRELEQASASARRS